MYNCKKFGDREWLFEAKRVQDDRDVCVKFVRSRYGYVVHKFLADNDLAPKLHSYDLALPGGWFAVIMDKVEGTPVRRNELTPSQKRSLQHALHLLHKENYVHGDLRPQNILAQPNKVCILDFDWAGECGEVSYPPELSSGEGRWAKGVKCGGEITKDHDHFHVAKLTKLTT